MKQRFVFVLVLIALVLVAACSREKMTGSENEPTSTVAATATEGTASATATHPASPGGTAIVPDVTSGTTVLVLLEDNSLGLPGQAIPPGPAVLNIENRGTQIHNLYVEGEGINRAAGDNIEAGGSSTIDVVFKPGTYTFSCPVLNPRENGEQATITLAAP